MRPEEIDHSRRVKHYIDVTNGEILAGKNELGDYIHSGVDPEQIHELGPLLREDVTQIESYRQEPLAVHDWSIEKYMNFGFWLKSIVPQPNPEEPKVRHINKFVLQNAYLLGVGPGQKTIINRFEGLSKYYLAIKANAVRRGIFDEWDISDFVNHIKKVGKDERPTGRLVDSWAERDPSNPSHWYIRRRFKEIGGFRKIVEMAGFEVINFWDKDDFINWGIKFMEANQGILPGHHILEYLSSRNLSPAATTIHRKFGKLTIYQTELKAAYSEAVKQKAKLRNEHLSDIKKGLSKGLLPLELFTARVENDEVIIPEDSDNSAHSVLSDTDETIKRYARYIIIDDVAGQLPETSKIQIAVGNGRNGDGFIASIRKNQSHITSGDIEHAALVLHVFDVIWPMDDHLALLKLDEDYDKWYKARRSPGNTEITDKN